MAITFITGVARSGKSYFSTHLLYQMYKNRVPKASKYSFINFINQWLSYYFFAKKHTYYDTVYTNINEFDFDFSSRIKPLNFKELVDKLTILHDLRVNQNKQDNEMIIKSKKLGLHNCLFVIDEGAHYFTKPVNQVLVWWLTYHGHLFQEIHIISQHMEQIPSEYTKNGEYFYMAYPPSSAIHKSKLTYGLYKNAKFYKNSKLKSFSVPLISNVYDLYVSGKLPERKPILKKFIPIFLILFLILFYTISSFLTLNDDKISSSILNDKTTPFIDDNESIVDDEVDFSIPTSIFKMDTTLVKFICINNICKYNDFSFPITFLLYIVDSNKILYSDIERISNKYKIYTLLLDNEVLEMLNNSFPSGTKSSGRKQDKSPVNQNSFKLFGD